VAVVVTAALGSGWQRDARAQEAPAETAWTAAPAPEGPSRAAPETYPPPPPTGVYRRFSLSVAAGPGALIGPGEQALALSHNVLRVGWGLARNLTFFASLEGARAPSVNPRTRKSSWLRHETLSMGVQHHFWQFAYLRGMVGGGLVGEETDTESFSGGYGVALSGAVGWELAQAQRMAVAVELAANITRYPTEFWGMTGLNLTFTFF
jgi:hypothetical protein